MVDSTAETGGLEEADKVAVELTAGDPDLVDESGTAEEVTAEAMIPATNPESPPIGL